MPATSITQVPSIAWRGLGVALLVSSACGIAFADITDCEGDFSGHQFTDHTRNILSQIDPLNPAFGFGEAADDFVGDGLWLIGVSWWGLYNPNQPPPVPPEAFRIRIYLTDKDGCPGTLLQDESCTDFHETYESGNSRYCCNFSEPFFKEGGVSYSLSIQAVTPGYFPDRFWFRWNAVTNNGGSGCWRTDEASGYPDWTSFEDIFGFGFDLAVIQLNANPATVEPFPGSEQLTTRAWPVPSPDRVSIEWSSKSTETTTLSIYTAEGRRLYQESLGTLPAGTHLTNWNGRADDGRLVPAGTYYYAIHVGQAVLRRKIQILY